jgi:hypothetical protein
MSSQSKEDQILEELRLLRMLEEQRLQLERKRQREYCPGGPAHPYDKAPLGQHVWDMSESGKFVCTRCGLTI